MFLAENKILKEAASMLYWTMLAACTVGPGTVVTCARAGAEFDLSLIWPLLFSSMLAYTLQEGTARLTIVSGKSLGQCLRVKYRHTYKVWNTAIIGWVVTISVFFGNTLYECNNWAGGIDAVLSFPGAKEVTGSAGVGLRVGCCIAYAVVVLILLYLDKTDKLGVALGLVMMGMVILFLVLVAKIGIDWPMFGWGLLPNVPAKTENSAEPWDIIISLVGTTSIGFNLFLGGAMAKGRKIGSAQRGIAFSTVSALMVSILILIVGAGYHKSQIDNDGDKVKFSITLMAVFIEQFVHQSGVVVFALGFVAAALSSMLTVPLGAALTADDIFSDDEKNNIEKIGTDNPNFEEDDTKVGNGNTAVKLEIEAPAEPQKLPRLVYLGIMFVMVIISAIVISANADRTKVILVAQVFNGCLLPFFCICLLLCLNDKQFMAESPQKGWSNLFLFVSVTITLFLASNVIVKKVFGTVVTQVSIRLGIAVCVAVLGMTLLCFVTSLGRDLLRSARRFI